MKEYAIIATVNDQRVVTYVRGTIKDAMKEAQSTRLMLGAESVTIAEVCAYVDENGDVF